MRSDSPVRRLPTRATASGTPTGWWPARLGSVQFGLLHHVEDVEDVATAERIRWCRAGVNRNEVGLLGARHTQWRQIAVTPPPTAPASGPAARGLVIAACWSGDQFGLRFGDRLHWLGQGRGGFEHLLRSGPIFRQPGLILAATTPPTTAPTTALGFPALFGVFAVPHRHLGIRFVGLDVCDLVVFLDIDRFHRHRIPGTANRSRQHSGSRRVRRNEARLLTRRQRAQPFDAEPRSDH